MELEFKLGICLESRLLSCDTLPLGLNSEDGTQYSSSSRAEPVGSK